MGSSSEHGWRRIGPAGAAALAIALVFVVVAARHIDAPGLYPDEMRPVLSALAFVKGDVSSNVVPGTGPAFGVGAHKMKVMTVPYVGSIKPLALAPVAATHISAASMRYFAIVLGALALLATFAFARRLFRSEAIALVAVALLALDPGFVFYVRHDFDSTAVMLLATGVGGWQLLRWWETKSLISLVIGSLALGIGLYDKFTYVWVVFALAAATALVAGRAVLRRLDLKTAAIGAGAFVVGCLPLIVYNLRSGFGTVSGYGTIDKEVAGGASFPPDERMVPTGSFLSQLEQRVRVLGDLIDGSSPSRMIASSFPHHFNFLPLVFAFAAVAIAAQLVLQRPPSRELRAGAFALAVTLLVLLVAAASRPAFHGHHVILAYPFPQLGLALVIVQGARLAARALAPAARRPAFAAGVVALAAVPVLLAAITTFGMFDAFANKGGRGVWSDGVYRLARDVDREHAGGSVMAVDWGLAAELTTLSQGRVDANEIALGLQHASSPAEQAALVRRPLADPRTWYVLRTAGGTATPSARRRFLATAARLHAKPKLVHRVDDRQGRPAFEIYTVTVHE